MRSRLVVAVFLLLVGPAARARADVESELRAELVGRFGVARSSLASECTDHYTDNEVAGARITGSSGSRFPAGELVRIDNVKVGAFSGLELNLSLVEPFRWTWQDGPYEVHEQRRCRVQLHFQVAREVRRDRARALAAIEAALSLHADETEARGDALWNRRKVEPYPDGWEKTKRLWEAWRRSETNRRVRAKTESVLEQADRVLSYLPNDEKYLSSFGAGARARGSESWSSCEGMLAATFYVTGSGADARGWADGQLVAWAAQLARALAECYVEE